ncbi:MAG: chromosome segregation protein SMC [Pirellulaceae bacterium]
MLKALELIGFKSFADKTRFEFPKGITVVVGPNGSGKSNVVDAIKWVLGEQSAKSLRGKDMADVIFKGSSEGRRMINTAEATIVFDNEDGRLPVDATEVHVTRRVYRSGEGEYLINREPCRLKDIRNLFRGTGVGTDAYSLIEQGKVDQMLQASAKDRRSMFEEAAGISRFKAKKLESQRRLQRVDQNLLRLSDIVDEVGSRLRSLRSQASKARRYREYRERLQELRTQVGLSDWRHLTQQLDGIQAGIAQLRDEAAALSAQSEALEASSLEAEVELNTTVEAIRLYEHQASHNREQIAGRESAVEHAFSLVQDLNEAASRHRRQLATMTGRAGDLLQKLRETKDESDRAQSGYDRIGAEVSHHEHALNDLNRDLDQRRETRERRRAEYVDQMRSVATIGNRISSLESQRDTWHGAAERSRQQFAELDEAVQTVRAERSEAEQQEEGLIAQLESVSQSLADAERALSQLQHQHADRRDELVSLQQRFSASRERVSVLDELDKSQEGLATGVRNVLELAREAVEGPFAEVQGLVADLIQAGVDVAPLVDVALGERAQYVVVAGNQLFEAVRSGQYRPDGRVGLVPLEEEPADRDADDSLAINREGVVGRLDRMVTSNARIGPLVRRLLGTIWCVETLTVALDLRRSAPPGWRFVTLSGELVESDGTIIAGSRLNSAGLVSRRSELRALRDQTSQLQTTIGEVDSDVAALSQAVSQQERAARDLAKQHKLADTALADQRARTRALRERCEQLERQRNSVQLELQAAEAQQKSVADGLQVAGRERAEWESRVAATEEAVRQVEAQIESIDARREKHARDTTAAKVELAKSEQHFESLRSRLLQLQEDQRERSRALAETDNQLKQCVARLDRRQREILAATSELAELYLRKESLAAEARRLIQQRDAISAERVQFADQLNHLRRRVHKLEEKQHKADLEAGEIRHKRSSLADRMREDYEIELAEIQDEPTAEELAAREEVEQEIAELRRKINNIGAVNQDALGELDELEGRFASLSNQFQDLTQAKEALERIIHKINADSRRLFTETLDAIRINFQSLYRKAFGGGRADLVLEEGVDPLEAGVDIIATPPGKPSFNNSLLSGGEKALTAVSLLLAIFQYRPSPFCVLDEVDAPFDEANIGRFVEVLRGFLDWTKFVVVTHSKKTMTAATTLYGVTMQESGVSKQVSVRFEDVSEDGHISQAAIDRDPVEKSDDERGAA